jgi:pyruvate dehydrogenase E2 component (dihydrolipoamide acetyltransferase)
MPFTVTMPKLSPTMEEGSIAKWHKKEGDKVEAGELLLEVATDKATIEYNALDEGYLRKILVSEGKRAKINEPIAIFTEKANEKIEGYIPEGIIVSAPAEKKQVVSETKVAPIPSIQASQMPAFVPERPLEKYDFPFPSGDLQSRIAASPLAKKLAKEKGLDLSSVKGSGPNGRVTSRDLDLAQSDTAVSFSRREMPNVAPGSYEEVPLSPMRRVIAERLQQAKSFIPHIYVRQEIDVAPLVEIREQLKKDNLKITFNDFCIRASAIALKEHPSINSGFNSVTQSIILFKTVDISVAVTVEGGLITPIIRHADYKNLGEISTEIKELASRAKLGKLKPEEYKGGSFTISNMGMYGVTDFCAIINPPQSCILAVGGIEECVWVRNGVISPGKKLGLVLSADHRVVDGAAAAQFLKTLQKLLENPALLLV